MRERPWFGAAGPFAARPKHPPGRSFTWVRARYRWNPSAFPTSFLSHVACALPEYNALRVLVAYYLASNFELCPDLDLALEISSKSLTLQFNCIAGVGTVQANLQVLQTKAGIVFSLEIDVTDLIVVATLRTLVDDVRLTVRERHLTPEQTERLLNLGQGCLNCLLDLEELLRKHQSLGNKAKRTFDRLRWDKVKVAELRQVLISNTGLLNAFNISLTRSATARIENLLRGFLQDYKAGRHEGSLLSVDTARGLQNGDDDVWKHIREELESAGITVEQVTENKKFIADSIISAIQACGLVETSTMPGSGNIGTDSGSNSFSASTLLSGLNLPTSIDFPGKEFRWCRELVGSVDELYRDGPEQYEALHTQMRYISSDLP